MSTGYGGYSRSSDYDEAEEVRGSAIAIYNPDNVNGMASGSKTRLVEEMDATIGFMKDVGGLTDKQIDDMKVADVKKKKDEITKNMTVGKFKKWVKKDIKPEPVVVKIGRFVKNFFMWPVNSFKSGVESGFLDETTLSLVFGTITVIMVGLLVFRAASSATGGM